MKFLGSCLSINRIQKSITIHCIKCFRYVQSRNSDSRSMFFIMLNDCFQHKMHIKMLVRTSKLAKFFRGCIHVPRFNRGGNEKGERAGVERRRGEGKER